MVDAFGSRRGERRALGRPLRWSECRVRATLSTCKRSPAGNGRVNACDLNDRQCSRKHRGMVDAFGIRGGTTLRGKDSLFYGRIS